MSLQPIEMTATPVKPAQTRPEHTKLRTPRRTPEAHKGGFCAVKNPHPESIIDVDYIPGPDLHIGSTDEQTWEYLLYHLAYITGCQPASRHVYKLAKRFCMRDARTLYMCSLPQLQSFFGTVPGRYIYDQLHRGSSFAFTASATRGNLRTLMALHPTAPVSTIHRLHVPWRIPLEDDRDRFLVQPRVVPHLETIWEEDPPKREYTRLPEVYQYAGRKPLRGYTEVDGPMEWTFESRWVGFFKK